MKSAIRSPNLGDLAIWPLLLTCPLLVDKTAIAATGLVLALDNLVKFGIDKLGALPAILAKTVRKPGWSPDLRLFRNIQLLARAPRLTVTLRVGGA